MQNLLTEAAPISALAALVWLTGIVAIAVLAHARGVARGRGMERGLQATRSTLEAAVHGVPDRRRQQDRPPAASLALPPSSRALSTGARSFSRNGLVSSRQAA